MEREAFYFERHGFRLIYIPIEDVIMQFEFLQKCAKDHYSITRPTLLSDTICCTLYDENGNVLSEGEYLLLLNELNGLLNKKAK